MSTVQPGPTTPRGSTSIRDKPRARTPVGARGPSPLAVMRRPPHVLRNGPILPPDGNRCSLRPEETERLAARLRRARSSWQQHVAMHYTTVARASTPPPARSPRVRGSAVQPSGGDGTGLLRMLRSSSAGRRDRPPSPATATTRRRVKPRQRDKNPAPPTAAEAARANGRQRARPVISSGPPRRRQEPSWSPATAQPRSPPAQAKPQYPGRAATAGGFGHSRPEPQWKPPGAPTSPVSSPMGDFGAAALLSPSQRSATRATAGSPPRSPPSSQADVRRMLDVHHSLVARVAAASPPAGPSSPPAGPSSPVDGDEPGAALAASGDSDRSPPPPPSESCASPGCRSQTEAVHVRLHGVAPEPIVFSIPAGAALAPLRVEMPSAGAVYFDGTAIDLSLTPAELGFVDQADLHFVPLDMVAEEDRAVAEAASAPTPPRARENLESEVESLIRDTRCSAGACGSPAPAAELDGDDSDDADMRGITARTHSGGMLLTVRPPTPPDGDQ